MVLGLQRSQPLVHHKFCGAIPRMIAVCQKERYFLSLTHSTLQFETTSLLRDINPRRGWTNIHYSLHGE